jgi:hypothetical protein
MKTKLRKFCLWTYDVWGNAEDGYGVNDRYKHGIVTVRCKREVFNVGTPHEFETFEPTDRQLSRAAGFSRVQWEGQDGAFYAETARGKPVGELIEE